MLNLNTVKWPTKKLEPEKYSIAICNNGIEGIIVGFDIRLKVWKGFSYNEPHKPWQSKNPKVIGKVGELTSLGKKVNMYVEKGKII
jgi:hypothetical protein